MISLAININHYNSQHCTLFVFISCQKRATKKVYVPFFRFHYLKPFWQISSCYCTLFLSAETGSEAVVFQGNDLYCAIFLKVRTSP